MTDDLRIATPERVEFSYDLAGLGSRFMAGLFDLLILVVALILLTAVFLFTITAGRALLGTTGAAWAAALYTLISFLLFWGYFVGFEWLWNGQSPGKRLTGLRVVQDGGYPVRPFAVLVRNLIRPIDLLTGIGVIAMFADPKARRLGDLAAGTIVVKEKRALTLDEVVRAAEALPTAGLGQAPTASPDLPPPAIDSPLYPYLHRLSYQDYLLARQFLQRRGELAPARRAELAAQIAAGLRRKLDAGEAAPAEPFPLIEEIVRAYPTVRS